MLLNELDSFGLIKVHTTDKLNKAEEDIKLVEMRLKDIKSKNLVVLYEERQSTELNYIEIKKMLKKLYESRMNLRNELAKTNLLIETKKAKQQELEQNMELINKQLANFGKLYAFSKNDCCN